MTDQLKIAEASLKRVRIGVDECNTMVSDAMNCVEVANSRLDPSKKSARLKAADWFGSLFGKGGSGG